MQPSLINSLHCMCVHGYGVRQSYFERFTFSALDSMSSLADTKGIIYSRIVNNPGDITLAVVFACMATPFDFARDFPEDLEIF